MKNESMINVIAKMSMCSSVKNSAVILTTKSPPPNETKYKYEKSDYEFTTKRYVV